MERRLTKRQKEILDFLKNFFTLKGYPPTLREIAYHFGLKGPMGPQKVLKTLERKGYIRKVRGSSRAIEIIKNPGDRVDKIFPIPLLGSVKAGEPITAIENIEGYINVDQMFAFSDNLFLLRVKGDSMIDAQIKDGDFALVKPQSYAKDGEIVVALIEDEATIKRIFKKRDSVILKPENPFMKPIVVRKEEKKFTILGKVVGIFRKL